MGNAALHALFAGKGATTSLFATLALEAAVLISIALAVIVAVKASIVSVGSVEGDETIAAGAVAGARAGTGRLATIVAVVAAACARKVRALIRGVGLRWPSVGVSSHVECSYMTLEGWPRSAVRSGRWRGQVSTSSMRNQGTVVKGEEESES